MPRRGGQRPLDPGEKSLWQTVTKSVAPLAGTPSLPSTTPDPASAPRKSTVGPSVSSRARAQPVATATQDAGTGPLTQPPRLDAGDPKAARRVARGRVEIDATLDLHGFSQASAEQRLRRFIEFAAMRGDRVLLVITGKGVGHDSDHRPFGEAPRGVLRRRFLEWVETAPLRDAISSVRQSHQRHGGRGAFYVFLKSQSKGRLSRPT